MHFALDSFFDELDKLAAAFTGKLMGPTAQTLVQERMKLRAAKGMGQAAASAMKVAPRPLDQSQILAQMKARVNPALTSPQVQAAQKAEAAARSGALQRQGKVTIAHVIAKMAGVVPSTLTHAAEIGGLATLAKPSFDDLRNKELNESPAHKKRRHAKYELAGLGILAAPSAIELGHHAWQKMKPLVKKAAIPVRPPLGSRGSGMIQAAHNAMNVKPKPLTGTLNVKPLVSNAERQKVLAPPKPSAVGGHAFKPKSALDLPAKPAGPMIIER